MEESIIAVAACLLVAVAIIYFAVVYQNGAGQAGNGSTSKTDYPESNTGLLNATDTPPSAMNTGNDPFAHGIVQGGQPLGWGGLPADTEHPYASWLQKQPLGVPNSKPISPYNVTSGPVTTAFSDNTQSPTAMKPSISIGAIVHSGAPSGSSPFASPIGNPRVKSTVAVSPHSTTATPPSNAGKTSGARAMKSQPANSPAFPQIKLESVKSSLLGLFTKGSSPSV
jgi:hypothetical protein